LSPKSLHCTTCFHPDAEAINAKRRKGQTLRSISREHGIPTTSLVRHFKHSGIRSVGGDNVEQVPISENGRNTGTDAPPEGADPLLWELGQLRKVAQGALAHATRTRNLTATASLLRSANGLLETVAKVEKDRAEQEKVKQAAASLPSPDTIEEIERWLAGLRARVEAAQAMQQPQPDKPTEPGVH
jgi:hypothetical protein